MPNLADLADQSSTMGIASDMDDYQQYVIQSQENGETPLPMKDWQRMKSEKNKIEIKLSNLGA